jgi:putative ABC transport system permease protein
MELGPIFRALMHNPTRFWLITVEVALTLAIVVNCVAIILEQRELLTRPSGLDEPNLVVVTTDPFATDFAEDEFIDVVRDEDLRRLRALPGVRAAAAIDYLPLAGGGAITGLRALEHD